MLDPVRDFETARCAGLSTTEMLANCDAAIDRFASRIAELAKTSGVRPEQFAFLFQEILNVASTRAYVLARAWNEAEQVEANRNERVTFTRSFKGN
jgi:hypothetical protein